MTDLTDRYREAGLGQDDFFPPVWESIVYKDQIWQVQWDADPNFPFFWNKDLFEKSGLDPEKPPTTIEEVDEYSAKILKKSGANVTTIGMIPWDSYGYSNSLFTWGFAHGATFFDKEKEEVTPDSELSIKALEWIVNYAQVGRGCRPGDRHSAGTAAPPLQHRQHRHGATGRAELPRHQTT